MEPPVEALTSNTGTLHVMDRVGDIRLTWDTNDAASVAVAQKAFDEAKSKGFLAYSVDPADGSKGEVVRTFNPTEQRAVIMSPQTQGG